MSVFDDVLAADATNTFLGEFAETVTYTPFAPSVSNATRSIQAVVFRLPPAPANADPNWVTPKMVVHVANSSTLGISSAQIDTGGDTLTVAYRPGETATAIPIALPKGTAPGMDAAMLTIELY
jgi:hypothetical protein